MTETECVITLAGEKPASNQRFD